jgi:hypothetical protein
MNKEETTNNKNEAKIGCETMHLNVSASDPFDGLVEARKGSSDALSALERKNGAACEMILEGIMERGEVCVCSDLDQMSALLNAVTRLRNRSGVTGGCFSLADDCDVMCSEASKAVDVMEEDASSAFCASYLKELGVDLDVGKEFRDTITKECSGMSDTVLFKSDEEKWTEGQEFLSRKRIALERLNKIVIMKVMAPNGLEVWIFYNRDSDSTECVHRSKNQELKLRFFLGLLARRRQLLIAGEEFDVLKFLSRFVDYKFTLAKDSSGVFSTAIID